jgi:hypothetical protein
MVFLLFDAYPSIADLLLEIYMTVRMSNGSAILF